MTDQTKAAVEAMAQADYKNTRKRMPERLPPWEELPLTGKVLAVKHSEIQHAAFLAHIDATGWQIVPKVATEDMERAAFDVIEIGVRQVSDGAFSTGTEARTAVYVAMLAAAPKWGG